MLPSPTKLRASRYNIQILKVKGNTGTFTAGTDFRFPKPQMHHSGKIREEKGTIQETGEHERKQNKPETWI